MVSGWGASSAVRRTTGAVAFTVAVICGGTGDGQTTAPGLTVIPVSFKMRPGQMTDVLSIQNHSDRETDFQVRAFAWDQSGGVDRLTPTDLLVASPPLGRIPVGGQQVVRIVVRQPAQGQEATFRIVLDQIPPPPEPGIVNIALRLSIPVFVEPAARDGAHVRWNIQSDGGVYYLVAVNSGVRHDAFRHMALTAADGRLVEIESNISPYVLPGATRRWRILSTSFAPAQAALRLTAVADSGPVDQPVSAQSAGS